MEGVPQISAQRFHEITLSASPLFGAPHLWASPNLSQTQLLDGH